MGVAGRTRIWRAVPLLLATALIAAVWWPALLGQRAPAGDGQGWFLPHFVLLADHIHQGQLLSWDPWTAGGVPTFTEPQAGAFSPITLAFAWVSGGSLAGYNAYVFFPAWLAMAGMYLLARIWHVRPWGAAVLGLGYAGCGVFIGQPHLSHHVAMAAIPWVLWRIEAYLRTGRRLPLLQAGAIGGLAGLSAHPAPLLYGAMFCGLYLLGRLTLDDSGQRRPLPWDRRGWILAAAAICIAVVSPVYILFKTEGTGVHTRTNAVTREMAQAVSMHPKAIASAISPALPAAHLRDNDLWPGTESSLASVYSGVLPLLLAGLCLAARPGRTWSWWLFGCGVLFLALSMGRHLPVHGAMYDAIPPLRLLRHAAIFRVGWMLAVALLAIQGMRILQHERRWNGATRLRVLGLAVLSGITVLAIGLTYVLPAIAAPAPHRQTIAHLMAWGCGCMWLLSCAIAMGKGWHMVALVALIQAGADYAISYRLSLPLMFAADLTYWSKLSAQHSPTLALSNWSRDLGARGNQSAVTVTRRPAFLAHTTLKNGYLRPLAACAPLQQMVAGERRVWFCPEPPQRPSSAQTLAALIQAANAAGQSMMVLHPPSAMHSPAPPAQFTLEEGDDAGESSGATPDTELAGRGPATAMEAELLEYRPEVLRFAVQSPADGWVMVTDRWSAGWQAEVNGKPTEVWGANLLFRAVQVPAGKSTIVFRYRPAWRYPLLALSWGTLAMVGGATLLGFAARRARRARALPQAKCQTPA